MPFEMVRNDITKMKVDAIVNAANRSLLGGGGVDGAIHRAAGPELLEACRTLGGCGTGEAKITKGYRLPARYVIHTVGPVWHGGMNGEKELLSACYRHSLELAAENGCETVAFPMISAGAYGYPKDQALAVAVDEIAAFLLDHEMTVYLVIFGHEELVTGKKLFRDIREYIDDVYAEKHYHANIESGRRRRWQEDEEAALELDLEISQSIADHAVFGIAPAPAAAPMESALPPDWEKILKKTDEGFSEALLRLIGEKGMTEVQCYKKANVDRKLFSKILSNPDYKPSKPTALAFAVSLELSLPEAEALLKKAGFSLTRSRIFDLIVEYCISHGFYNIYEINEILFEHDQPLLGSGTRS
jgi:O-acetyl-ADP-ribose deacetylase (regulator of RNase III)